MSDILSTSPGTSFTNIDYAELAANGILISISWEDSNGTLITIFLNAGNLTAALVSITLDGNIGGASWIASGAAVSGITISGSTASFSNVTVTDNITDITINGTLNRADP